MVTDDLTGKCKFCYWNRNLPRCHPARMIGNLGNCLDWRMYKLSDTDKAAEKAKQADAHMRDRERRKMNRKQRRKDARGGA